jgi:hypothetical protein
MTCKNDQVGRGMMVTLVSERLEVNHVFQVMHSAEQRVERLLVEKCRCICCKRLCKSSNQLPAAYKSTSKCLLFGGVLSKWKFGSDQK